MSKIISLFLSFIVYVASLLGVSIGGGGTDKTDVISYNFSKTEATVSLTENPSTGYKWKYNVVDERVAFVSNDNYISNPAPEIVGAPGTRQITFKGLKTGATKIILTYEREWEKQPIRTIVIYLSVGFDLKLDAQFYSDTDNL